LAKNPKRIAMAVSKATAHYGSKGQIWQQTPPDPINKLTRLGKKPAKWTQRELGGVQHLSPA
jgi:hypothetical protein